MLNATLSRRIEVTPDLLILTVTPDGGVPDFLPGQYVALGLPGSAPRYSRAQPEREVPTDPTKIIKRAYSIGSAPSAKGGLEFFVAIVPDGGLSPRLAALREGDRLFCAPKITGTFTLEGVPLEAPLVFVATGTGLAPFIAMLRTPGVVSDGRKIAVLHGVRHSRELGYDGELRALAASHPGVTYLPTVSREDPGWQGERGRVSHLFERGKVLLDPSSTHIFLCGNPAMIEELEGSLLTRGFTLHERKKPGTIHVEKYW